MPAQPRQELPRVLTATHAASIVVGIIIGSGIFLVPREMMAAVGSSSLVYAVWIAGGLLSLFGAMSYAELAAMKPRVGGEYAFLLDAYGPTTAFLYTWTWTTIAKPASIATIAAGLMRVLGTFATFSFLTHPALGPILWSQVAAIVATWLITGLNILGTLKSANVQTALTWLKVLIIVAIAAFCFTALNHNPAVGWHNFSTTFTGARGGFSGFMIALVAALWAYDGWSDVSQMAGEVRNPQRSLPRALVGGVAVVGALYMLTNAAIQYALPATSIANSARPAADAMRLAAGPAGAVLVSIAMAISIAATFVGSSLSGARVPFAAAQDHLFPPALAAIHPRFHTPWKSLILQAVISSLLLLAVGKFQALFSLAIISEWLFYALTTASVFIFRAREPDTPRPYRVTGYPIVPALFIAAAILLMVFSFIDQPWTSLAGAAVILAGIPIHRLYQHHRT
ncbi:MAG: amino acid permease [Acidobacteriota bacterium]